MSDLKKKADRWYGELNMDGFGVLLDRDGSGVSFGLWIDDPTSASPPLYGTAYTLTGKGHRDRPRSIFHALSFHMDRIYSIFELSGEPM